jgi:hypothetical protein
MRRTVRIAVANLYEILRAVRVDRHISRSEIVSTSYQLTGI